MTADSQLSFSDRCGWGPNQSTSKRPHPAGWHLSSVCMPWDFRRTRSGPKSFRIWKL